MAETRRGGTGVRTRSAQIVTASWVGILANAALAVLKLIAGFASGSFAVVSDGVDSVMDVLTSAISLVAARITEKPPDVDHPYGHTRAETIATKTFSFVIFFAGAQLAISSVTRLISGERPEIIGSVAILVTAVSIVVKTALFFYKLLLGRKFESKMLVADAKNMRGDIVVSVGVLASLAFVRVLELPILDTIAAILISVWIMYVAFQIFLETNSELMEGFDDTSLYGRIFDAVESVPGAWNPHRARIRTIGTHRIVDLDIEVDGNLTVQEAHEIAQQAEDAIVSCIHNVYDVLVHVEPRGTDQNAERFGVSRTDLEE